MLCTTDYAVCCITIVVVSSLKLYTKNRSIMWLYEWTKYTAYEHDGNNFRITQQHTKPPATD